MISKRLIGVITVKQGWAVQSFGYNRYLPLGRAETLAANLDRWGADEILLQCIDRTKNNLGPDLTLLERISRQGLSTPLIYSGGIRSTSDGLAAIKSGADRICIDALLHDDPAVATALATPLGAQAVIAALPLSWNSSGELQWWDYRSMTTKPLPTKTLTALKNGVISEALIIDWQHEGHSGAFDTRLTQSPALNGIPLIAFGGLDDTVAMRKVLHQSNVVAIAQGNFLSHREHAIQAIKAQLTDLPLRPAHYEAQKI